MADPEITDPFEQVNSAVSQPGIVDPFTPGYVSPRGPLVRGMSDAVRGLKGIGGGIIAAAGDAIGSEGIKQYGLDVAHTAAAPPANPAEGAPPQASDIHSIGDAANFAKYGVGYAIPNALAVIAAGLVGRVGGGKLAKGVADAGEQMWLKNAGAVAGVETSNVAQQVGMIYPEAVDKKVENPLTRSALGGIAAGTIGTMPEAYIAARLGLLGKSLAGGGTASSVALNALKEAGIAGTGAAVTGASQTGIQRAALGQPLDDEEAQHAYIENAALGAVGGAAGGAIAGAVGAKNRAVEQAQRPAEQTRLDGQQEPSTAPQEQITPTQSPSAALSLDVPAEQMSLVDNSRPPISEAETNYLDAVDRQKTLESRATELDAEDKLPADSRRSKQEISAERIDVTDELSALPEKIKNYETLMDTPEYQPKGTLVAGELLGRNEQPDKPVAIISPAEHEIIRQVEQELPHSADPIDAKKSIADTGHDEAFTAQVARIKQGNGLLVNANEARALRRSPAPEIQTNVGGPRRATFKQATAQEHREFILDAGTKVTDEQIKQLQSDGLFKDDKTATSVRSGFNNAVSDMLKAVDSDGAKQALEEGVLRTLKGKVAKIDAQTIADSFVSTLMKQRQNFISPDLNKPLSDRGSISLFSKAAIDPNRVLDMHTKARGSATDFVSKVDRTGTFDFAVPYPDREVSISGHPTSEQLKVYTDANRDLLSQSGHTLVTRFDDATQHTLLNVASTTPDFAEAARDATQAGLSGVINLRDMGYVGVDGSGSQEPVTVRADRFDRIMTAKGEQATDYLTKIIGSAVNNLEVRTFMSPDQQTGIGTIRLNPMKDVIELALNAKDMTSAAAHEGYHYLEFRVLSPGERAVVDKQFRPGTALYERLLDRVRAYDMANGTKLLDEVRAVPAEARAYGFEFWRRGDLDAPTAIGRFWDKIKQVLERVGNAVQGLGFQSRADIFSAIDKGRFAQRDGNPFRTLHLDREPLPVGTLQLMSRSALEDLSMRSRAGEVPTSQLHGKVAEMLEGKDIPAGLREKLFRNGTGELQGASNSLKRAYLENISSGLNIARHSAGYKNVFNVLTTYTQRKNRLIADNVETRLSSWVKGASDDDKRAVSTALLERTVGEFTPSSAEYRAIYQKLTDKQRGMFDQATDMIGHTLDQEFQAEQQSYAQILGADSEAYTEWVANRAQQVERLKSNGYFPERRYGDHIIHSYIEGTDGKKMTLYYTQHEREADARAELPQVQQAFASDPLVKTEYGYKYKAEYDGSMSMQQFLDLAARNGVELSQSEKERLAKVLISADSTRRNRIFRRQNIVGYSDSGLRILAEHGVSMANKITYAELHGALSDAMSGKEVQTKFGIDGRVEINAVEGSNVWAQDGEMAGFYRNLADKTADFVMSPREGSKLSAGLRAAASIQFLGGSLSAGVVQLSSIPMNTIPWLTQHTSYTDALGKTLSGFRLAVGNLKALTDIPTLLDRNVRIDGIDSVDGLRHALTLAAQDGTTLDTEIHQIMGLARGQEYSFSSKARGAIQTWMLPFQTTEKINRLSTFIAAYKVAKDKNLDNGAAYKLAQDTVYGTQFRYDEANRPAIARSPVGALLFTFRSYPIFMTETLVHLAKEKPSAAVAMLFGLSSMAGIEGMPFAEDIEDLIDTVAYRLFNSPFNSKRALRNVLKNASEAMVGVDLSGVGVHGVANELTGMQFASRVGLGNIIPGTRIGTADAEYKSVLQEVLGPVASQAMGVLQGVDSLTKGQYVNAMKQALPLAAQNFVKGAQQWQQGFATDLGGRKLIDVSGPEAFWQSLGFSSTALAKAYEADTADKQQLAFYQQAKQQFMTDLTKAVTTGDLARAQEVGEAIAAWNKNNPEMPLAFSPDGVRKQLQLAGLPLNSRTFLKLPKLLRGTSESAVGLDLN